MSKFFKVDENDKVLYLYVKIKTGAKENSASQPPEHLYFVEDKVYLKINIRSAPIDGQANKMLISFLSKLLNYPKSQIEIVNGHHSKFKSIVIRQINISFLDNFRKILLKNY